MNRVTLGQDETIRQSGTIYAKLKLQVLLPDMKTVVVYGEELREIYSHFMF